MSPGESVTEQGHVLGALAPPNTSLDLVVSHANGFHAQRALLKAPSECEEDACEEPLKSLVKTGPAGNA